MSVINEAGRTWSILKHTYPTPYKIREVIDEYLTSEMANDFDWEDVNTDGSLENIQTKNTHFFTIYAYYDNHLDSTVVTIKVKDSDHVAGLTQYHKLTGIDFYTIYCSDMEIGDFVEEFADAYSGLSGYCGMHDYRSDFPDD